MEANRSIRLVDRIFWSALLALLALSVVGANAGAAQPGEVSVYFVAFACEEEPVNPYAECDALSGASFQIEADGVALAGSPFTTGPTSLVPGFMFDAPEDATLTITQLNVDPPGYAPATGFDPLVIDVAAIPEVGCGGESTCPGIEFINLPFAVADGPPGDEVVGGIETLPTTGSGQLTATNDQKLAVIAGLVLFALGLMMRTRRAPVRGQ